MKYFDLRESKTIKMYVLSSLLNLFLDVYHIQ